MMFDPDGSPVPWPTKYKVTGIETAEVDDDTSHMTGEAWDDGKGADAECEEGQSLANGKKILIGIRIKEDVDGDGTWEDAEGIKVEMEITWTQLGQVVCATHTKEIGDGVPRELLSDVVPELNDGAVQVTVGSDDATLNDICLAETDGYRFQDNGDIVLKGPNSTAFNITLNTEILIFTEEGEAASTEDADTGNLRIDDRGNFVFNVRRNGLAELHVVLVIRNLKLEGLDDYQYNPGRELHADLSGSAISGHCLKDVYHLATMVEEE
jgi:hypothetical protein